MKAASFTCRQRSSLRAAGPRWDSNPRAQDWLSRGRSPSAGPQRRTLLHWHTHPPRVGYVLSGAKIRVTEAHGTHEDYDEKTGETYWTDFSPLHDTLNLDTKPYIALLVEVKGAPSKATPAN